MPQTNWEKTKIYSKKGFDKAWHTLDKLGAPVNRLSNKLGAEAFWPTTLDKESDKAARILRSFCKDGFYAQVDEKQAEKAANAGEQIEGPKGKQRVLKKIPEKIIREAKGLAIFTTMRTGLWVSGAGGSGILVARTETGEWSPPSGILLHTAGLGFLVGVDIYDCVIVINTEKALESFTKVRCTLGGEVSAVAGPVGIGGILDTEVHKRQAPVWTYLKSRGFYAGVQVDGTIIIERTDENEAFYGRRIPVKDILAGKARHPPISTRMLMETIKAAQGDTDVDESVLPDAGAAPSDMEIDDGKTFGVPETDDPDPFGVRALEKEGLEIREAGTRTRPSMEAFEFKPSPTSPIYNNFTRRSLDSPQKSKWRASSNSVSSMDRATQTVTREIDSRSPSHSPVKKGHMDSSPAEKTTEHVNESDDQEDGADKTTPGDSSPPELHEAAHLGRATPMTARVVSIPKRVPPALPPRNPERVASPTKDGFDDVSLNASEHSNYEHEAIADQDADAAKDAWKAPESEGKTPNADEFHSVPNSPT